MPDTRLAKLTAELSRSGGDVGTAAWCLALFERAGLTVTDPAGEEAAVLAALEEAGCPLTLAERFGGADMVEQIRQEPPRHTGEADAEDTAREDCSASPPESTENPAWKQQHPDWEPIPGLTDDESSDFLSAITCEHEHTRQVNEADVECGR